MPLIERAKELLTRQNTYNNCDSSLYDDCYYSSPWSTYGRWILLAAIIVGAFLIFLAFSCITARRRRRNGMQPFRGTAWAGAPVQGWGRPQQSGPPFQQPYGHGGNMPQNELHSPPPQYQANSGFYGKPNATSQDPYGGQQNGVELQEPSNAYNPQRGGETVYSPPEGPPPGKGDGIVR